MEYVNIGIGLLVILCGFLVKQYPNMIAGFHGMSDERKAQVDIDGLASWIRIGLIATGLLTILVYYIVQYFGMEGMTGAFSSMIVIGGVLVVAMVGERYDRGGAE